MNEWALAGDLGELADLPLALGPYEIVRWLAQGGMATLFEAWDAPRGRSVALKVARRGEAVRGQEPPGLGMEAAALSALDHPRIVRLLDRDAGGDPAWLALEYLPGLNLAERILEAGGRLSPAEVEPHLADLAAALVHAHGRGIVHGDVKPSNLVVDEGGRVSLVDFGLASAVGAGVGVDLAALRGGVARSSSWGTPAFMAPELYRGAPRSPATDAWAAGAVAFVALTGERPYTLYQLWTGALGEGVSGRLPPGVSGALRGALEALLCADEDRRLRGLSALGSQPAGGMALDPHRRSGGSSTGLGGASWITPRP